MVVLADYAFERERRYGTPGPEEAFFRTDASERISYNVATMRSAWCAGAWAGRPMNGRVPRGVHDLRHRMVVRRIETWHAQGVDVDAKIPALAT